MAKSIVYTKTGDGGKTSLVGGTRVPKTHVRLEAYGTVDELNSFVGLLVREVKDETLLNDLAFIQHKLFSVGGYLASEEDVSKNIPSITESDVTRLEDEMDRLDGLIPRLNRFVLPGGSEAAARAHICRTVCRRAERRIYDVSLEYQVEEQIFKFVNRLSDFFFVLARYECVTNGTEIFWDKSCS
ncbi:MAG: ATP:cob(I)alamin adenosyltransferase [Bacteroidales bacterium 45-6]|nr:MAG: ATP:cob(I)alamin adenosyltransferase [Bacteroidales bacterium 45-6]